MKQFAITNLPLTLQKWKAGTPPSMVVLKSLFWNDADDSVGVAPA